MAHSVLGLLEGWARELRDLWFRGLILLHTSTPRFHLELVAGRLRNVYDSVTCIVPSELREAGRACDRVFSPSAIEALLGTENDAVLIAVKGLLRPNLLAAAAETVRGGGVVGVVVPPLDSWQPGGSMSTGYYKSYLVNSLYSMPSLFWADLDRGTVYSMRLPQGRGVKAESAKGYRARSPVHRKLIEACASREQAEALDRIVQHLRSRGRSVLVLGDRGRGKSGLLGLVLAYLIATHMVGFVPVTAPGPHSVQSLFRVLGRALERLGVRSWAIERGGYIIGVAGPWFHIRYHTPDRVEPGSVTVVDEAAALGPLRLRAIARRAPRLLAATTIHGYEGSGRVLAKASAEMLREPRLIVELREPVRYAVNDPLESWLYNVFMLRVEEPEPPRELRDLVFLRIGREQLIRDRVLLERLYSILVNAHYRNEPDDLAMMIDAPHHTLYALAVDGVPVAVAQVSWEDTSLPREARILPDLLAQYTGEAGGLRGARVVRIAVHSMLQRRGLGSLLLHHVEGEAKRRGAEWIGAVFGRPDVVRFWISNGYLPVYISPLPNRLTGEHNIAVVKPLTERGWKVIGEAVAAARRRLLLSLHNLYRGLPAEVVYELLRARVQPQPPLVELTQSESYRLKLYLEGRVDVESILDIVWLLAVNTILERGFIPLESRGEAIALIMRVLQGKTAGEVAAALGIGVADVRELLRRAVDSLLAGAGKREGEGAPSS